MELGDLGVFQNPRRVFRRSALIKFLCSKEHLDWLKIDLNTVKIITVKDYKHKKTNVNGSTHIQANSQSGNI